MKIIPFFITAFIVLAETVISFNSVLLPSIKENFALSDQSAQMTLVIGLFALGFSGVVYGGLSDSFGRRPMLIFSIFILSLSTLLCSLSNTFFVFVLARFFQGLGSGAGWVVGNACLKDIYHDQDYINIMNIVHAIAGIIPAVIPVLGLYMTVVIGWRSSFFVIFIFALILSFAILFFLPETIKEKKIKKPKKILHDYGSIFFNDQFLRYCSVKVLAVSLLFCEISTLPLVFMNYLDVSVSDYGWYLLPAFLCYIFGGCLSSRLSKKIDVDSVINAGFYLIFVSNVFLIFFGYYFETSALLIQSIKCFTYAGWGCIYGNATAQIVSSLPEKAGMTSAMMIALEMLFSSIAVYVLGFFFNGTIVPLSFYMIIISVVSFFLINIQKFENKIRSNWSRV